MKIKCLYNNGKVLGAYEEQILESNRIGKFGATENIEFGVVIGNEYLVMGIMLGEGALSYLIDHGGYVSAYPYPLFEVVDKKLPANWFFKSFDKSSDKYPYQEAVWGYYELVFDDTHYEKLVDTDDEAMRIYFKRKIEFEDENGSYT